MSVRPGITSCNIGLVEMESPRHQRRSRRRDSVSAPPFTTVFRPRYRTSLADERAADSAIPTTDGHGESRAAQ